MIDNNSVSPDMVPYSRARASRVQIGASAGVIGAKLPTAAAAPVFPTFPSGDFLHNSLNLYIKFMPCALNHVP
jgi:hypothetical protein